MKHGIKKEIVTHYHTPKHQYEMRDYLFHHHIELGKSMAQIARENGVSGDTIRENLKKNGIKPRQTKPHTRYSDSEIDEMVGMYCSKNMSANAISKIFNTDHNTIIRLLRDRGVKTRDLSEAQYAANGSEKPADFLDGDLLHNLHWVDGLSCKDIGDKYGVDPGSVRRQMRRLGIPTKTNAESKIGLMTGSNHPNWKGGVTPLYLLLREYFHVNQVPRVAERDLYTCQLCGKTHTVLHVHHIRDFSEIVKEICGEHPHLSPAIPEDRSKLYEIITHDSRFLDEDNLITLCRDCHFFKIHNYKRKTISSQASVEEGSETIPEWEYTVSD